MTDQVTPQTISQYFQCNTKKNKSIDLFSFQPSLSQHQHNDLDCLEEFYDHTTESLSILNFKPHIHSQFLDRVLKGCSRLKTLSLGCAKDPEEFGKFIEIDPKVIQQSSIQHLVMKMHNTKFTNYLIPQMLDKIKILNLSGCNFTLNSEMKFKQLEELGI